MGRACFERDLDALLKFLRSSPGRAFVTVQDDFLHALGDETQRRKSCRGSRRAGESLDRDLAKLKQQPR